MFRQAKALQAESDRLSKIIKKTDGTPRELPHDKLLFLDSHSPCLNCKIGEKNMNNMAAETKECFCGETITRQPGQSWASWSRQKYCKKHSEMNSYQRNKAIKALAGKPEPETNEKQCPWCKENFVPKAINQKYCSYKCGRAIERKRENERNKKNRAKLQKLKRFNPERAEQIAASVTAEVLSVIEVFESDEDKLKQIRHVAEKVGIECQRRMIEAAIGSGCFRQGKVSDAYRL